MASGTSDQSPSSRRNSAESLNVPSICCLGPAPFPTSVKALNSDQAILGANSACFGSPQASITLGRREAGRTSALTAANSKPVACDKPRPALMVCP